MTRFVELNHPLEDGMAAYPGLPRPKIGAHLDHDASRSHYGGAAEFYLGRIDMACNVGTYIDSPFHRHRERADLSRLPLEHVAGLPGIALDAIVDEGRSVTVDAAPADLAGRAVLVRSGWDARWGDETYWEPGPFLAASLVERLIAAGARLVGVDFWNVDDTTDPPRPAHTRLLAADVLVVEHMCSLGALPRTGFRFNAVPLRIVRGASFPVRAYAEIDDEPNIGDTP